MSGRPIGVFDSGLGGLTVVRELMRSAPHEDIVYFGDTGRVPYGTRSVETIEKYARQDIAFLRSMNVKLIIAACGTVSAVAPHVGRENGTPFIEVVGPAAAAAVAATKTGRIGVIGTTATVRSGALERAMRALRPGLAICAQACPLFVPLVENGWFEPSDEIARLTAERYLEPLKAQGVDTLILGCTHFPLLKGVIAGAMGPGVALIDPGVEAARAAAVFLTENGLGASGRETGTCRFFVSDVVDGFSRTAGIFLGRAVGESVTQVEVDG